MLQWMITLSRALSLIYCILPIVFWALTYFRIRRLQY